MQLTTVGVALMESMITSMCQRILMATVSSLGMGKGRRTKISHSLWQPLRHGLLHTDYLKLNILF
jgi:hypothetical protein